MEYQYYIEDGKWKFSESNFSDCILGVCISVDSPEYYRKLNEDLNITRDFSSTINESIITVQKHGIKEEVKKTYLIYVDSPLREFCDFHYIELKPTELNCSNINHIISTSCLPVKFLNKLIEDNNEEI